MCRSTKHTAALELKSVAKSSKLLLYSAKLAMDDGGNKAASKVLNELYTDPCGNSAELLLSNSNPKQGSSTSFCFMSPLCTPILFHFPSRYDPNDPSWGLDHDCWLGIDKGAIHQYSCQCSSEKCLHLPLIWGCQACKSWLWAPQYGLLSRILCCTYAGCLAPSGWVLHNGWKSPKMSHFNLNFGTVLSTFQFECYMTLDKKWDILMDF